MAILQWNESFSVGVTEIDRQHQKLVAMINELSEAMKQGKGKMVLGKVLNNLIDYTATHFQTEEKYFDQYNYPKTSAHTKEHTNFVINIMEFKKDFDDGKLALSMDVMHFL